MQRSASHRDCFFNHKARTRKQDISMSKQAEQVHETAIVRYLSDRVSRTQLLVGIGAGVAAALLPTMADAETSGTGAARATSFPFFPTVKGTYTTEAISDILNVLVTAAYLRATVAVGCSTLHI
jgi:hypothetical protein